jgi:hypothetical protein
MNVSIPQDKLSDFSVGYAIISECGAPACKAANPANITPALCALNQPASTFQYYLTANYACGPQVVPALPSPMPDLCPSSLSQ